MKSLAESRRRSHKKAEKSKCKKKCSSSDVNITACKLNAKKAHIDELTVCSKLNTPLKKQLITSVNDVIDPEADVVIFERNDWKQPNGPFNQETGLFDLPTTAHLGKKITFYNSQDAVNVLEADDQYQEFWHIVLMHEMDSVTLEWLGDCSDTNGRYGWVVVAETNMSNKQMPMIHSLNQQPTKYVHVLCPTRRIPIGVTGNPASIADFVATVDCDKAGLNYGTIVNISWGSASGFEDDQSVEYHHGGIIHVGDELFLAAGALRWQTADTPNGGSSIDFHHLLSDRNPNVTATAEAINVAVAGADSIHTIHENPYTGNILATYFGTPDTGSPSAGPGGFIDIESKLLLPQTNLRVLNYHTIGLNPAELGPDTLGNATGDNWNYDFAINMCNQTLVSSSWAAPFSFENGFDPSKPYGRAIRVFKFPPFGGPTVPNQAFTLQTKFTTIPITQMGGNSSGEGVVPLEVRRVHAPIAEQYFVGITLPGGVDYIYQDASSVWQKVVCVTPAQLVADCTAINAAFGSGIAGGSPVWYNPFGLGDFNVPLVTDITVSGDDRYLYVSCWLAGCVIQYDITQILLDPTKPVTRVGGIGNLGGVRIITPTVNVFNTNSVSIKGTQFNGGPQMLRLTADGQRLFITNSLFSAWDDEFYPSGAGSIQELGGKMICVNTGVDKGVKQADCTLDTNFLVDFNNITWQLRDGTTIGTFRARAHECHIPGVSH
jgi:hypothetical protein